MKNKLQTFEQHSSDSSELNIDDYFLSRIRYEMMFIAGIDLRDFKEFLERTSYDDIDQKIEEIKSNILKAKKLRYSKKNYLNQ